MNVKLLINELEARMLLHVRVMDGGTSSSDISLRRHASANEQHVQTNTRLQVTTENLTRDSSSVRPSDAVSNGSY